MELPDLGAQCALAECRRLDFLPIKCSWCGRLFCSQHYLCERHSCGARDHRQVPVCPLCNQPVPLDASQSADRVVSDHIDRNCSTGRPKLFANRCSVARCRARELVPLRCAHCGRNHCIAHRHPADHQCPARRPGTEACPPPVHPPASVRHLQGDVSEQEALDRAIADSLRGASHRPNCRLS